MQRRIAFLLLAAALAPAAAWAQARLVSVTGTVSLRRAGRDLGPQKVQATVRPGDEIATGENSEALVQAPDGSTVRVYPDSRVVLQERTPNLSDWLHLFLGSVKVHVQRLSGRPNPQSMTTPTAVIAVRGTTFDVFVDEMDATMVHVDEGLVSVASREMPNADVLVHPGQRTWVRRGMAPTPVAAAGRSAGNVRAGNKAAEKSMDKGFRGNSKPGRGPDAIPGRALGRKLSLPGPAR